MKKTLRKFTGIVCLLDYLAVSLRMPDQKSVEKSRETVKQPLKTHLMDQVIFGILLLDNFVNRRSKDVKQAHPQLSCKIVNQKYMAIILDGHFL